MGVTYLNPPPLRVLLERGWITGYVKLELGPFGDAIVCRIGEYWFYFGGETAEGLGYPTDYLEQVGVEDTLREIESALESFRENLENRDEYNYYHQYLCERYSEPAIVNEFMDYLRKYYELDASHQRTVENLLYAVPQYVHDPQQQKRMLQEVLDFGLTDAEWEGYFGETMA